ncbi:MAG: FtsX-like permease family protein [Bacteroidota bacterium]
MNNIHQVDPPRWADRLLEKLCRTDYLEEIQGDLHESFYWRLESRGAFYARWHFVKEMALSCRPSNLKKYNQMNLFLTLFKSHLKTGWRFLWKTRAYSSINILGLAVGIVFSWFAYLYASDQYSYNKHIKDVDNLYRMSMQVTVYDNLINFPGCSHFTTQQIAEQLPEVTEVVRFTEDHANMKVGEGLIDQEFYIAEQKLFEYLDLEFVEGTAGDFEAPMQAIISERLAYKLGIRGEALEHHIQLLDSTKFVSYQVVGVYKNIPDNTSIGTDMFLPYSNYLNESPKNATNKNSFDLSTLLKITEGSDLNIVSAKIKDIINEGDEDQPFSAYVSPLASLHLSDKYVASNGFRSGGNSDLLWLIVIAGAVCMVISVINYANFCISLYINRSREVAIRKIIGSANRGVFQQLMTESFLTTLLATVLAIGLYALISPHFSLLVEKEFTFSNLINLNSLPGLVGIVLVISLISGLYPSLMLSKIKILQSLKGVKKIGKGATITQALLMVQFSISIIMIGCMLTFQGQLKYMVNFDKGYDMENILKLNIPLELVGHDLGKVLVNELQSIPEISKISGTLGFSMTGYKDDNHQFSLMYSNIDSSYIDLMKLNIIEGQSVHDAIAGGIANGVVVNQSFLKSIGNPENPIGMTIPFDLYGRGNSVIVGILKDYYIMGAKSTLEPLLFYSDYDNRKFFRVLVKSTADRFIIEEKIEAVWNQLFDPIPLRYDYLATEYTKRFEQEAKISKIAGTGSMIAIFIAAFGLLGLVGLNIQGKLKEVSIRRVLGAGVDDLTMIMIKRFLFPIIASLAIGLTASYYLSVEWLSGYPNKIDLGWEGLLIPTLVVLSILIMIVLTQVARVLKSNPATHLKDD